MHTAIKQIQLHKDDNTPLYIQLADGIADGIVDGSLLPDSKLPPIRKMAEAFGINSVTVVAAYKHLETKQMVYSRVGSGTFVCPLPIEEVPTPVARGTLYTYENTINLEHAINFTNTALPYELFPVEAFQRAFNAVLEREQGSAFRYTDSMGYVPLREQLQKYLEGYAIKTTTEHIQVISGAQQGIDLLSKAMLNFGDVVFVESPTFYGATGAFLSRGAKLIEIPLEQDGMNMEVLEQYLKIYPPKFIYMMSYFQTPTGISYSLEKKRKLLELAEKYDTYIIEEDDFYDFSYGKEAVVPLKALDYKNRVIYIKSFSKILMPGLRMGLLVLPKKIKQRVLEAKYTTDISTSGFIQKAMELYLKENDWEKYAKTMREIGGEKYRRTLSFCKIYLQGKVEYSLPNGGVSLWIQLPTPIGAEEFCTRMLEKNVILVPGAQYELQKTDSQFVRLCFANVSEDKIEVGIKRMGDTLSSMLAEYRLFP